MERQITKQYLFVYMMDKNKTRGICMKWVEVHAHFPDVVSEWKCQPLMTLKTVMKVGKSSKSACRKSKSRMMYFSGWGAKKRIRFQMDSHVPLVSIEMKYKDQGPTIRMKPGLPTAEDGCWETFIFMRV